MATKTATKNQTKHVLTYFWQAARRYPGFVTGQAIALPITILINNFIPPLILADVLNRLSEHDYQPHRVWASFGGELVWYFALSMVAGVIAWRIVDAIQWRLEARVERDIARHVFTHLMDLSADFHANSFGGSLVSHSNKLMGAYIRLADSTTFMTYPLVISLVFTTIILGVRAPLFAVCLLLFSVIYLASAFYVTRPARRLSARQAAAESRQTGYLADMITNVMAVKSFAGSSYETKAFNRITDHTSDTLLDLMRGSQRQLWYFSSMAGTISGLSLTFAVMGVLLFNANIATVFLIFNYTAGMVNALFQFSNNTLRTLNRAFGDASDMVEVLRLVPEVRDPIAPEPSRITRGAIRFESVGFAHKGAGEALFDRFDLDIKPGEKVGLVGHSGSGKTTFTRLLLRFSDIQAGEILIDGQNIAHITQDDLRRSIAYVPQEPLLFHRSISENIAYGSPQPDQQAVEAVAKLAHAAEFIDQLPERYDTLVGERGVKLSGGQRQRIAIARAMLKNAPILLLDEATSALDSESEALIQDALWTLMEGRTAIVIAHRLSTIQRMDRIVVLDAGKIVEQGTHKELIRAHGTYAKLWARQSGGFMDD